MLPGLAQHFAGCNNDRSSPIVPGHPLRRRQGAPWRNLRVPGPCPSRYLPRYDRPPAVVIVGAVLIFVGSRLGRLQSRQITRLWNDQKRLRDDPANTEQAGLMPTAGTLPEPTRYWRVTCSCGFRRDATSAEAAQESRRLHVYSPLVPREQDRVRTSTGPRRVDCRGNPLPLL